MTLPFNLKELEVGQSLELDTEAYRGQVSRAAYNAGLSQRKLFSTRRFDGRIYVIRVM